VARIELETRVQNRNIRRSKMTTIPAVVYQALGRPAAIRWVVEDGRVCVEPVGEDSDGDGA